MLVYKLSVDKLLFGFPKIKDGRNYVSSICAIGLRNVESLDFFNVLATLLRKTTI